jgi:hypothetical protein
MSAEGRRQLLGIFRHYGHGLRAQFRGAGSAIGVVVSILFALHLGSGATLGLCHSGFRSFARFSVDVPARVAAARVVALTFQVVPFLAFAYLISAAGILFSPNQRREMLALSAWPIRPPGLALMKLLDGHFWMVFTAVLAVPGMLRSLACVHSLDSAFLVVALVALYLGLALVMYFLGFAFIALGASLYGRGLRAPPALTVFVPLWIALGLVPAGLVLFPEWSGLQSLLVARYRLHEALLVVLTEPGGALAFILVALLTVYAAFRLAWFLVGWGYVGSIEHFEGKASATRPASTDLGKKGMGFRLLAPPVGAILRKDLRILSRHPMILITAATTLVLSAAFLRPLFLGVDSTMVWPVFAGTGPILLQVAYHELMTMEGPGGEHLMAFPASARDIMTGKVLSALVLNLPFPVLGLVMMSLDGLRAQDVSLVVLWVTWLPCAIVTQLALAGAFARRKATRLTEQRSALSTYVGFPVQIPFTVALMVFVDLAESEPLLAVVGAGCFLSFALVLLRLSIRMFHLMER